MSENTAAVPAKIAGFDVGTVDVITGANQGASVELFHPVSGADLGVKITVLGRDSDEFRRVTQAQNRRRVAKMQKGGFRASNLSADEIEAEGIELLAACTKGWTGMVLNGKDLPFTRETAVDVYTKYPWIKEQIDTAIADRSLFTKV